MPRSICREIICTYDIKNIVEYGIKVKTNVVLKERAVSQKFHCNKQCEN